MKVAFHSGMGILICPHMRVVCIIDTAVTELRFVSKQDVTMQLATAKFQPLSKIARSEMLHSLLWCGYMPSAFSDLHTKTSCNSSRTRTWTALYHLNNAFFIDASINITLGCNANAGKCTGISQCLVNSSKHSSDWYSTVRETSLIFSYSMN